MFNLRRYSCYLRYVTVAFFAACSTNRRAIDDGGRGRAPRPRATATSALAPAPLVAARSSPTIVLLPDMRGHILIGHLHRKHGVKLTAAAATKAIFCGNIFRFPDVNSQQSTGRNYVDPINRRG